MTASVRLRFQIQKRCIVYLHHILNQEEESLLKTFFNHQLYTSITKDWTSIILKDLTEFEIDFSINQIMSTPSKTWKGFI